ncbi:MAG: hypothetical protein AAF488_13965 [Planctomycetota bacterium]
MNDDELRELILRHRRGRDAFDALAVRAVQLYLAGQLLPPLQPGEETPLSGRLAQLRPDDLRGALDGDRGEVPLTRAEYDELLGDIVAFVRDWLGGSPE